MPITGFLWDRNQGFDIHVLRNDQASKRLDEIIYVVDEIADNNNKLVFKTSRDINSRNVPIPDGYAGVFFMPSWEQRATRNGSIFEFNGITLNVETGEITARQQAAPRITSFVLRATLMIQTGNAPPALFSETPMMMVHLHDRITDAWITPSTLSARPDVTKGISNIELRLISNKVVEKIVWRSDDSFSQDIDQFLLITNNPFNLAGYPVNHVFVLTAPILFDNRRQFTENQVFTIPIHLEVKYVNQADSVRVTLPTHVSHFLQTGQTLDDGAGNDLFEVVKIEKKAQYRASVYALFDDQTMGDITNNHGLTWAKGAGVNANDIVFDGDGAFEISKTAVGKTLTIIATLPARLAGPGLNEVLGQVVARDSWLNENPVAQPVPGSPTHLYADKIPNVLFIAEGFDNLQDFERIALSVYNKLRGETKTAPWNHLFTYSMNAWMLFERSEETAASILYESVTFTNARLENGNLADVALPLFDLIKEGSSRLENGGGLTVEALILQVGLPIPADANANRNAKIAEWRQLSDPNFGNGALAVSNSVFDFWIRLAGRRLIEERNSLWGLRCGEKPKIVPVLQSNIITFNNQSRIQRANVDLFLSRIRANTPTGEIIGEKFWGRDQTGKFGKDYGLVIFLVGGLRSIGTRNGEKIFPERQLHTGIGVGLVDDHVPLNFLGAKFDVNYPFFRWSQSAGRPSLEIVPFGVPTDIPISAFATIAHELCHSFNLDDEYARAGNLNIPARTNVDTVYNLQLHGDLLDTGQLSGERIKWRWPRMRKAGVLVNVSAAGNTITVGLRAGHAAQFEPKEVVRLRHRDILASPLASLSSPELKVLSKNETDNTLVLEALSSFDSTVYGKDSLLFLPVKAPAEEKNNPTHDKYAEVLSPLLRHQINQSHRPQTNFPCSQEDRRDQQDPVNVPSNLGRPSNRRQVIGLFSGGKEFSCGIYHPSGECIMRKEFRAIYERIGGLATFKNREIYQFCHVCQYSLVDQIDPSLHDKIDAAYDKIYPKIGLSPLKKVAIVVGIIFLVMGAGYGIAKLKDI